MKELLSVFVSFFKIGLFTFGGGYSMLPMLEREIVTRHGWATEEELLDYFAVGQCTPGVIAVNTAAFIGYKRKKILGAIFATVGVVLPSLIIITAIAALLGTFSENIWVARAFKGIRVAVGALIAGIVVGLVRKNVKNVLQIIICVAAFVVVAIFGISPVPVVISAGVVGLFAGKRGEAQ